MAKSIINFFLPNSTFEGKKVPTGVARGRVNGEESEEESISDDELDLDAPMYPKKYQVTELENYALHHEKQQKEGNMSNVDSLNDMLSTTNLLQIKEQNEENTRRVYTTYSFDTKIKHEHLPIDNYKQDILDYIDSTSILVIRGETGCGKSTQVPQFILDDARKKNVYCNVIVTQPRRIAAISVAKRVCEERCWQLGSICGYQVGLENITTSDTILNYVTTGVLLQKLIYKQNLNDYTHIIIDEVHERTQEMDFLLLLVRRFIRTNSLSVKVIIMSATIDTDRFAHYFRTHIDDKRYVNAPVMYITKESNHRLLLFYLEQMFRGSRGDDMMRTFNIDEPEVKVETLNIMINLIKLFDTIDYLDPVTNTKQIGHVLVFLPGCFEIETAYNKLLISKRLDEVATDWLILPLHSMNTSAEQQRVFQKAGPNQRKIILSTNIAESSLTLADIEYVIDFCLTKTLVVDPLTGYQSLKLQWASKVNCDQRAGRAGRVKDGRVYRLIPRNFYKVIPKDLTPEMLSAPLERVVLGSKMLEIQQPPESILALALDPPHLDAIETTILNLKEAGALLLTCNGTYTKSDGDITFLGRIMCNLPLDIKLSKLIVMGYMFGCMDECIIMAAGCSLTNIFKTPFQERLQSYNNKLMWADGSCSDLIAYLNLYKVWEKNKSSGAFVNNKEKDWCASYFLSNKALREWSKLVDELRERLQRLGIRPFGGPGKVTLSHVQLPVVVKIAICAAFYPNFFKRTNESGELLEREALKEVNGLNPMQTVYYTNMDSEQPGPLYAKYIKKALEPCSKNVEIRFDSSSKVYVTFKESCTPQTVNLNGQQFVTTMPGKIPTSVYRAVKMRQLKLTTTILHLKTPESWKFAEAKGIAKQNDFGRYELISRTDEIKSNALPTICDIAISIRICYIIDAGHFFAQPVSDEVEKNVSTIDDILNFKGELLIITKTPKIGELYAAKFEEDDRFYRCKVIGIAPGNLNLIIAQVLFIDFGNIQEVPCSSLYRIPEGVALTIPPQAIECVLSKVKPSAVMNSNGMWSEKATDVLRKKADAVINARIYSVVNNVVSLELCSKNTTNTFNLWLIENNYGEEAEESLLSKEDYANRSKAQQFSNASSIDFTEKHFISLCKDVEPPHSSICHDRLFLKGPFSPLEMKVHSMVDVSQIVTVDANSVNSVLLDTDPQDNHERIIVAGGIAQSAYSTNLSLRDTTMMPNIHGLPMLMALLFCPRMVPKPTQDGVFFSAVLCGLGENEKSGRSVYPEHDMVVYLDTELTRDDMTEINEFRYWLNKTVECMEIIAEKNNPPLRIEICQRELHTRIFKLLHKPRINQERRYAKHVNIWHKFEYLGDKLLPGQTNIKKEIWPLHWTMELKSEKRELIKIKENLETMSDIATKVKPLTEIKCKLCNLDIYSVTEMRVHLSSSAHRAEEGKIKGITEN